MAIYAIGDVQGCYDELLALLEQIRFDPAADQLWFAGDLVNRGPKSLLTLRFAKEHATATVLGNHDLHLLASASQAQHKKRKDTMQDIIEAPDRDELLDWLRHQPLLHHDNESGYTMIHAGLPPQWNLEQARCYAGEVERALRGSEYMDFFNAMYGNQPDTWSDELTGWERLRYITNCLSRLRYCDEQGRLALDEKGPPGSQPTGYKPWFAWPNRNSRDMNILFGHWSTLGACDDKGIHSLDTGCLWGGTLTALKLGKTPQRIEVPCPGAQRPGSI